MFYSLWQRHTCAERKNKRLDPLLSAIGIPAPILYRDQSLSLGVMIIRDFHVYFEFAAWWDIFQHRFWTYNAIRTSKITCSSYISEFPAPLTTHRYNANLDTDAPSQSFVEMRFQVQALASEIFCYTISFRACLIKIHKVQMKLYFSSCLHGRCTLNFPLDKYQAMKPRSCATRSATPKVAQLHTAKARQKSQSNEFGDFTKISNRNILKYSVFIFAFVCSRKLQNRQISSIMPSPLVLVTFARTREEFYVRVLGEVWCHVDLSAFCTKKVGPHFRDNVSINEILWMTKLMSVLVDGVMIHLSVRLC